MFVIFGMVTAEMKKDMAARLEAERILTAKVFGGFGGSFLGLKVSL
jgi:hypothetical protein